LSFGGRYVSGFCDKKRLSLQAEIKDFVIVAGEKVLYRSSAKLKMLICRANSYAPSCGTNGFICGARDRHAPLEGHPLIAAV
jgi:hypothetical protein